MKKIMFNDRYGLTEAVLSGRKTQTRRVELWTEYSRSRMDPKIVDNKIVLFNDFGDVILRKPTRYKVGDVVAVAQSYKDVNEYYSAAFRQKNSVHGTMIQQSDCVSDSAIRGWFQLRKMLKSAKGWLNKMFVRAEYMPFHIRITDVRMERLQDISDEDCMKEGIMEGEFMNTWDRYYFDIWGDCALHKTFQTPRAAYASLIDRISGRGTWERNPCVVVYDFEVVK